MMQVFKNKFENSPDYEKTMHIIETASRLCSIRLCSNSYGGNRMTPENRAAYWRANLQLVFGCLVVWFVCSYGFGILLVDVLNSVRLGGFQLGFWFAQQGSIYVFVALIFFYAWRMNKLDLKYDVHEN